MLIYFCGIFAGSDILLTYSISSVGSTRTGFIKLVKVDYSETWCFVFLDHLKWKDNLAAKAAAAFLNRQKSAPNLRKLVYEIGKLE